MMLRWIVLAALIAAGIVAYHLATSASAETARGPEPEISGPRSDPGGPSTGSELHPQPSREIDTTAFAEPGVARPEPREPAKLVVAGRLIGEGRSPPSDALISVCQKRHGTGEAEPRSVTTSSDDSGSFALDIMSLLAPGDTDLTISVDHPAYLKTTERLFLVFVRPDGTGSWRVERDIYLRKARILSGRVIDESGQPVPAARVASVPLYEPNVPSQNDDHVVSTDAEGLYSVRCRRDQNHLVIAIADELQPASRLVAAGKTSTTIPDLVLQEGEIISGTARFGGMPAYEASVLAFRSVEAALVIDETRLGYEIGPLVVRRIVTAETNEGGRFELRGLSPGGPYKLLLFKLPHRELHLDVGIENGVLATAPSTGVALDVDGGTVEFMTLVDGEPTAARIHASRPRGKLLEAETPGALTAVFMPGMEYTVRVSKRGFETQERAIVAPSPRGRLVETFHLQKATSLATLDVVLVTPDSEVVERAALALYDASRRDRDQPDALYVADAVAGAFRFEGVLPGTWNVVVRPGGWADQPVYLRDAECTVEIHEDDKTQLRFTLSCAGRLGITARDGQGRRVTAPCRVMTGGRIRQALFRCHPDEGADTRSSTNVGAGVNEVYPALAPGDYRVELGGERFVRRGFDVTIEAGQTTELDVVLRQTVAPSPR